MKDKTWTLGVLLVAVLLFVLATSRDTDAQQGQVGRYQLMSSSSSNAMWRIDTTTGSVSNCFYPDVGTFRCVALTSE